MAGQTMNTIEQQKQDQKNTVPQRQLRGLYSKVNISVKSLNIIIVVLAAALILCMVVGVSNAGFTVQFDSLGGTTVESQKRQ